MHIGNTIRRLRKQRGITQEQLAENIGVTFQAVSKWENGITLPDIALAPVLAGYFNVSMDELFDFSLERLDRAVEEIARRAYQYRETAPAESRRILEEGLREYPENDVLLNNLLYTVNYTEKPDETIAIATKLLEKTKQSAVRYDALRFLAYAYKAKGDLPSAEAAIAQIPELYFTKLTEIAFLLSGEAKFRAAEKQKWISFENLLQMMEKIAEYNEETGQKEAAIAETETALQLLSVLRNPRFSAYPEFFHQQLRRLKGEP